jgi:hypothetical protein
MLYSDAPSVYLVLKAIHSVHHCMIQTQASDEPLMIHLSVSSSGAEEKFLVRL